jgi:hypothetical protein
MKKILISIFCLVATTLFSQVGAKHTLHQGDNRPDSENVVFTIMGDGFSTNQQNDFMAIARGMSDFLLEHYPFNLFKDRITIHAVEVISPSSGAGYFGYWDGSSVQTGGNSSRVAAVLNQHAPQTNQVMLFARSGSPGWGQMNVPGYGSIMSLVGALNFHTTFRSKSVMTHEIGHSFGRVLDEYGPAGWSGVEVANQTRDSNPNTNKWRAWLGVYNKNVPTGIYAILPGVASTHPFYNWFAPTDVTTRLPAGEQACIMRGSADREPVFCRVCAAEVIKFLANHVGEVYHGGNEFIKFANVPRDKNRIVDAAFWGNFALESVNIASTVKSIGDYAFLRCTSLNVITNFATVPQPLNTTVFHGINNLSAITLRVPSESVAAYKAANIWKEFNVIAIPSDVTEPVANPVSISRVRVNTWDVGGDRYVANSLFDGNLSTFWHARWSTGSGHGVGEALADVDLGEEKLISEIKIHKRISESNHIRQLRVLTHPELGNVFPNGETMTSYTAANVSQSQINADFATTGWVSVSPEISGLATVNMSSQIVTLIFKEPIKVRYIRLAITCNDGNSATYAQIAEFRMFGKEKCELCGELICDDVWCDICEEWNCDKNHVWCDICEEYDCDKEHMKCDVCGEWDCDKEHEKCDICGEWDCTENHETNTLAPRTSHPESLRAWISNNVLHIDGLNIGQIYRIFTVSGTLVYQGIATDTSTSLSVRNTVVERSRNARIYIIQSENKSTKIIW